MKNSILISKLSKLLLFFVVVNLILINISQIIFAQAQDFYFSGNDPDSYQCFSSDAENQGSDPLDIPIKKDASSGKFYCDANGDGVWDQSKESQAVLRPPALQQLEIWFVRIVYAIWAFSATLSFVLLLALAYQYIISQGDPTQIKAIREKIVKYIIGVAMVFLAVPILNTVFNLLQINDAVQCYQGLTTDAGIGFQFFFPDLCSDPNNSLGSEIVSAPCSRETADEAVGKLCQPVGTRSVCTSADAPGRGGLVYNCVRSDPQNNEVGIWEVELSGR